MKNKKHGIIAGLLSLGAATLLGGCSTILLLNPKGPIGDSQRFVIIAAIVLMAIVVIPVFIMNVWFPFKFRASNTKSTYMPKWSYSTPIDITMWAVPIAIVTLLGILAWTRTYSLDPYKPIPSPHQPITIEAVALDWKWLFIYPEQNIAAVNHITFPVKVPVSFKITSDTVMTSFFIPQLGSQIYAMAGMQTRLHLMADRPGTFAGHNQQLSGRGYPNMYFTAEAVSPEEFQAWVQKVRQAPEKLDPARYAALAEPNEGHYPVTYFSAVKPNLFEDILAKFNPKWGEPAGPMSHGAPAPHAGTGAAEAK